VIAEAEGDGPQVIVAAVDPARSLDARQRIPALKNERAFALPETVEPVALRAAS
jgi:hypothetical protein